jgi:hypothetical protein
VRRGAVLVVLAAAATAAASLAAAGALAAGGLDVRVSPRGGTQSTTFRVAFTVPRAAGHEGVSERTYSVRLVAARGSGCTRSVAKSVTEATKGERVRLAFRGRRPWCAGRGSGTISETDGPYCPNKGDPCPLFATRMQTIARFGFRVR